jgi:hypothetical protein
MEDLPSSNSCGGASSGGGAGSRDLRIADGGAGRDAGCQLQNGTVVVDIAVVAGVDDDLRNGSEHTTGRVGLQSR